jgi:hypothetical protein
MAELGTVNLVNVILVSNTDPTIRVTIADPTVGDITGATIRYAVSYLDSGPPVPNPPEPKNPPTALLQKNTADIAEIEIIDGPGRVFDIKFIRSELEPFEGCFFHQCFLDLSSVQGEVFRGVLRLLRNLITG